MSLATISAPAPVDVPVPAPVHAPASPGEGIFEALACPARRSILRHINDSGPGEARNLDLIAAVGLQQAAVTHHTNILLLRELVERVRRGKCNYYRLTMLGRRAINAMDAAGE